MDCAGGMLISPKKLERVLKKLKNGKGSPDQITADVLKTLPPECLEKLARSLSRMCWEMTFAGRLDLLADGNSSESGGCNVLDQVQANRWTMCDAKSLGLCLVQVTPSTEIRDRANCVCAEDTCRCWSVSAVESCRAVERVAERNCGSTIGREESVRPCGPSSGLQGNVTARCEFVLDGSECCNLEWKLYESAPGDGLVEPSSDEPRTPPGSAGVSGHFLQ